MSDNLLNVQFYKIFRINVHPSDQIFISVTPQEGKFSGVSLTKEITLKDISLFGVSFLTQAPLDHLTKVDIKIFNKKIFNRWDFTVSGVINSSYTYNAKKEMISYGVILEESANDSELMYFLKDFIMNFSKDRLSSYLTRSTTQEKEYVVSEALELFSLLCESYRFSNLLEIKELLLSAQKYFSSTKIKILKINLETDRLVTVCSSESDKEYELEFGDGLIWKSFLSGQVANTSISEDLFLLAIPLYNNKNKRIGILEIEKEAGPQFSHKEEAEAIFLSSYISKYFANYNPKSKRTRVSHLNPTMNHDFMFVGKTKLAITVRQALRKIRATNSNALIIGEDGLGKKNLAKSLHKHGHNALSELSSLDCQDNEALKKHFENNFEDLKLSEKGTIILEHIEKLDIQGQIHIYQHLKYSSKRIICTSKYDLEMMVNNEILIKEFFILISKFYIHLIPLRNRKDDIMTIANYFLLMEGEKRNLKNMVFSEKTKSDFLEYLWPGNIKEMESTIKKFFMIEAPRDELENKELNISTPKSSRKQSFATSLIQLACKLSEHSDASIHYKTHNNIISELLKNFKNAS